MSGKKREDIQGLRGFAIIMVLLFHFYPQHFPNGYVGVDMFFVISGYIISMVFPKELSVEKVVDFYYRRVKRILPLYFTTILTVLIATVIFAPQNFVEANMSSGQRAILLISNIVSATSEELNYQRLIDNAEDFFTHCWSLCLEMQWYLLAPAVFFFKSSRIIFFVLVISAFHYVTTDESTQFNCVFARLWQFLSGILAYEHVKKHRLSETLCTEVEDTIPLDKTKSRNENELLVVLSRLFLMLLLLGFLPMDPHPTLLRGIITISTSALLLSGTVTELSLLTSRVLSWIGNVSFSLYLVHWPIYVAAKQYGSNASLSIGLAVSFAVATLVYYIFEQKYLQWEKSAVLLFVAITFSISLLISINGTEIVEKLKYGTNPKNINSSNYTYMPWLATNIAEGGLRNVTNNLGSPLCKYGELFGIPTNPPLGHCQMPDGNGSYNILVLGNSYAANQGPTMIYKAFGKIAKEFDVYSRVGCEPLKKARWCPNYGDYGRTAVEYFKPDVLFLMQRVMSASAKINAKVIDDDPIFAEYLDNLRFYEKHAKKIYIQQALPWCKSACTTSAVSEMMKEGKNLTEIGDKFIRREEHYARIRIAELGKRCKNCELIDFLPYYPLGSNRKPVFYDLEKNLVLLDDKIHLNKFGKERIQPLFDDLARNFHL